MKTAVILLAILFAWLFYATVQGNNRAIEALVLKAEYDAMQAWGNPLWILPASRKVWIEKTQ